jgi:hypothetical protein
MKLSLVNDLTPAFGSIRDQGPRPTCLAFAVSDAHAALFKPFQAFSVDYLFYHAVQRMPDRNPGKAVSTSVASAALLAEGQPIESDWPYQQRLPTDLTKWIPPAGLLPFRKGISFVVTSFQQICDAIKAGIPMVLILRISLAFYKPQRSGAIEFINAEPDTGTHAVVAVGLGATQKQRYLWIRNSWGSGWGINGHAFLPEAYVGARCISAAALR